MTNAEVVKLLNRVADFLQKPGERDTALSLLASVQKAIKTIEVRKL